MEGSTVLPRPIPVRARRGPSKSSRGARYWAFLSYSHDDEEFADWLHEELEEFRVPAALVGRLTDIGPVPKRLTPIFRDRSELAAAGSLSEEIEEAIANSRFLIVLCSPAAATSRWMNEEIACFKRMQSEDRVLAAIIEGEPFASQMPGREGEECFPQALRTHYNRRGLPTTRRAEPVAADLRDHGDGRRLGMLKLVAGMLGVGLDDLVQRETHRRQRRLTYLVAASLAGMAVTSGLAVTAIQSRDAARDQRREAEGLIGFMLGDLRTKLEPIGRLDVLDSVGARALAYYQKQDKSGLSDEALSQRSRALTLMGEVAQTRGDTTQALRLYREAMAGTAESMRRAPDNAQRLFNHAQNVYFVGSIDWQYGNIEQAESAFVEYRKLADRMIALDPARAEYRLERVYADNLLGTVRMRQRRFREAAQIYQGAQTASEDLASKQPANFKIKVQVIDNLAWLADAQEFSGRIDEAMANRRRSLQLLASLWRTHPDDTSLKRFEMQTHRAIARLLATRGNLDGALAESAAATRITSLLMQVEPANTEWKATGAAARLESAELLLAAGRNADAAIELKEACDASSQLIEKDQSVSDWRAGLQPRCLEIKSRLALQSGAVPEAVTFAQQALAIAPTEPSPVDRRLAIARARLLLGDALLAAGDWAEAQGNYSQALEQWPKNTEEKPRDLAQRAILLQRVDRHEDANLLAKKLAAIGYREPAYVKAMQQRGAG